MNGRQGRKLESNYKIRRTQLFGPWGVGAIMPCPNDESLMIAGLDALPSDSVEKLEPIHDDRLARLIGVKNLLMPPDPDAGVVLPAVRFPRWLYCPFCHQMEMVSEFTSGTRTCTSEKCRGKRRRLIPERFIVICPEGHFDDFPVMEWVHHGDPGPGEHVISRVTQGGSASLGDIVYKCSCGARRSLNGATRPGALAEIGYSCKGSKPWLGIQSSECHCSPDSLRVVQRGGNNVWYPDVASSIFIPDGMSEQVQRCLEANYANIAEAEAAGQKAFDLVVRTAAKAGGVDAASLASAYRMKREGKDSESMSEGDYRLEEFGVLCDSREQQDHVFESKSLSPNNYAADFFHESFSGISLVSTLKETRALVGFSRLVPDVKRGLSFSDRRKDLSRRELDWTMATQSTGEGIFIDFNDKRLVEWLARPSVLDRAMVMQRNYDRACSARGVEAKKINPAFVMIHTFSHVLMLGLASECGYSAASVRERIYCDRFIDPEDRHPNMNGVLLYTASGDSEGSLGGLVRSGRPGRFEGIVQRSIDSACWCSSDPVCIESQGQGPESCNLAACYSCALVPETSCEAGNRLLDRAMLIGTIEQPEIGFFDIFRSSLSAE